MTALATSRMRKPAIAPRRLFQDIAYSLVSVSCWLAINCLAAAGVMLGFFALMANLSVDQFFAETANLSNHYLAADSERRSEFSEILLYLFGGLRSEEHTSELQSLMRISYAVFCLKKKNSN